MNSNENQPDDISRPQNDSSEWNSMVEAAFQEQLTDVCQPLRVGNLVMGAVDHVNGPSSVQTTVPISRFEARLLVRHWMEVGDEITRTSRFFSQIGSSQTRERAYAGKRVKEVIESGLVTEQEADAIADEVWEANAAEWDYLKNRSEEQERDAGLELSE